MTKRPALLEALADVQAVRRRVLDHQLFYGYSGVARIAGGCFALLGAIVLASNFLPASPEIHFIGWGVVCAAAAVTNFSALARWWRSRDTELIQLRPVLDLVAPFLVGGLLTFTLFAHSNHDLIFPTWMCLFGLMNIASRHSMPKTMVYLGWYYIVSGGVCVLMLPRTGFMNPWPKGLVFFVGEVIGGITFIKLRRDGDL